MWSLYPSTVGPFWLKFHFILTLVGSTWYSLDGNLEIGAHVWSNICYFTCHLIGPSRVTNRIFLIRKDLFSGMRAQHVLSYHLPWWLHAPCVTHVYQNLVQIRTHDIMFKFWTNLCWKGKNVTNDVQNLFFFMYVFCFVVIRDVSEILTVGSGWSVFIRVGSGKSFL